MKKTGIGIAVLVFVGAILLYNSLYIVKEGEHKIVLKFHEAVRTVSSPGLNFKIPFIETLSSLPKYQMTYENAATQILTKDKKIIFVDNYTVWRIDNPAMFLRKVGNLSAGTKRIDETVFSTVRRKLSEVDYDNIISEDTTRGNVNDDITSDVSAAFERDENGITIVDVRIKRTDLPESNRQSVFNRMISDRQSMAARYLSEGDEESLIKTSQADREANRLMAEARFTAEKIIAEGEQEAARIYNEAYGKDPTFYDLYRTLESYKVTLAGDPVIMMPIDSPYAKILLGK